MIEGKDEPPVVPVALTQEESKAIMGLQSYLPWVRPASTRVLVENVLKKIKDAPFISGSAGEEVEVEFRLVPVGKAFDEQVGDTEGGE